LYTSCDHNHGFCFWWNNAIVYAVVPATAAAPTFPADYNTSGILQNTATLGLSYTAYVVDKTEIVSKLYCVNYTGCLTVTASL
jgi:hypothetical protein